MADRLVHPVFSGAPAPPPISPEFAQKAAAVTVQVLNQMMPDYERALVRAVMLRVCELLEPIYHRLGLPVEELGAVAIGDPEARFVHEYRCPECGTPGEFDQPCPECASDRIEGEDG